MESKTLIVIDDRIVTAQSFELAPKGNIPFIDYQGKLVGDAALIIEMLKQTMAAQLLTMFSTDQISASTMSE